VTWLEKLSAAQYAGVAAAGATGASTAASAAPAPPAQPSRAQELFGDIAPGLAQLTDDVLYGDVWQRPGLSKRDRSLVTVSALVAMNRPEQLRSHLALAEQNGVTQEELVEAITHLAFYVGWPSAMTGAQVAREVFKAPGVRKVQ
jgi:4-carboxymuconolactone decarboxylase